MLLEEDEDEGVGEGDQRRKQALHMKSYSIKWNYLSATGKITHHSLRPRI